MPIQNWAQITVQQLPEAKRKLQIPAAGAGCPATTDALPEGAINKYLGSEATTRAAADVALAAAIAAKENPLTFGLPLVRTVNAVAWTGTTTDVPEGANLYYTAARFNTAFAAKTTTDLVEGINLYYTAARFATAFAAKTTSDLAEGTNLYFTNARADARIALATITESQVTNLVSDLAAKVATSRTIATTAPITGGGDLSADRTIAMAAATSAVDGYLTAANFVTFNAKVAASRAIATTSPITGGGDLSADRTFALDFTVAWTWTATNIAATPTDRIILTNTQPAIAGTQQYSPALRFTGQGWKSDATTGSKSTDFRIYNQPQQATGNPSANLLIDFSVDGGAFANKFSFTSAGAFISVGSITSGTGFVAGNSNSYQWTGRSKVTSPSDGVIMLANQASGDFTRLQFGGTTSSFPALRRTTTALNCRLADDSADAAFTALSFQSAAPTTGTSGVWKLGVKVVAAVVVDTAKYIELDVGGTLYKLVTAV